MEEKYKLTKEEKEGIKELEKFRKKAKNQILTYMFGDTLFAHMATEESKKTDKSNKSPIERMISNMQGYDPEILEGGKIKEKLDKELKYCERILYGGIISLIDKAIPDQQKCDYILKRLDRYLNKKLKPDIEEYAEFLQEAIDEHEKQKDQYREFKEKGYVTSRGKTRSERLKKQDKENREKMEKYHAAEDKTGLELPVAEGLKEPEKKEKKKRGEWTIVKLKDGSEMIFKRANARYLEEGMYNQVVFDLVRGGFFKTGDLTKGYIKCSQEDLITCTKAINHHYMKKLGTAESCSNEENDKLFKYAKPALYLSVDNNWKVTVMDPKTFITLGYYDLKKDRKKK